MKASGSIVRSIWKYPLFAALFLAGCGTLEIGLEPTYTTQEATTRLTATATSVTDSAAATSAVFLTPTLMPGTKSPTATPTPLSQDIFTVTGRARRIDPPTGTVVLIPETESPFANAEGEVGVRISEWAHIVDREGAIVNIDDFSRGIKLELNLLFRDGQLTSEEVVVLEPGVPRPEENPAYTDATEMVTPLAPAGIANDDVIQLFEVDGAEGEVDPGTIVNLRWSFNGDSGSICMDQLPRPMTRTCYQNLPASGSLPVTLPENAREAVVFSLFVEDADGVESADIYIPLSEGLGCEQAWFFESDYLLPCPAGDAFGVRPYAQNFERGLMLRVEESWLGPNPYLFVFIWDGDREEFGFTEGPILDEWTAEMSEQVVGDQPPEGFVRPSRGFGLLWSGQIEIPAMGEARVLNGQELIGWGEGPVYEYDARYQCAEEQFGVQNCYLGLPDGQIVSLPGSAG